MGALSGTDCYLSSPIECDNFVDNWRPKIIEEFKSKFGVIVYDPSQDEKQNKSHEMNVAMENEDYDTVEKIAKSFTKKDLAKIDRCSFLVACAIKGIPSTGVPCEVVHAINLKKPVMIVSLPNKKTCPKWYFGNLRHRYIFNSWDNLFAYLKEVDEYKHTENHRWWYTYKMI